MVKKHNEVIYIASLKDNSLDKNTLIFKVGKSTELNVKKRISNMKTASPFLIELLLYFTIINKNARIIEQYIHSELVTLENVTKYNGEWYSIPVNNMLDMFVFIRDILITKYEQTGSYIDCYKECIDERFRQSYKKENPLLYKILKYLYFDSESNTFKYKSYLDCEKMLNNEPQLFYDLLGLMFNGKSYLKVIEKRNNERGY